MFLPKENKKKKKSYFEEKLRNVDWFSHSEFLLHIYVWISNFKEGPRDLSCPSWSWDKISRVFDTQERREVNRHRNKSHRFNCFQLQMLKIRSAILKLLEFYCRFVRIDIITEVPPGFLLTSTMAAVSHTKPLCIPHLIIQVILYNKTYEDTSMY